MFLISNDCLILIYIFSDLKDMKVDHIINTFPKHQAALRAIFQKHSKIPDCRFHPTYDECPFLLILDGLLNQAQQTEMYQKIRSEFCDPDTTDDITSKVWYSFYIEIVVNDFLQLLVYFCCCFFSEFSARKFILGTNYT